MTTQKPLDESNAQAAMPNAEAKNLKNPSELLDGRIRQIEAQLLVMIEDGYHTTPKGQNLLSGLAGEHQRLSDRLALQQAKNQELQPGTTSENQQTMHSESNHGEVLGRFVQVFGAMFQKLRAANAQKTDQEFVEKVSGYPSYDRSTDFAEIANTPLYEAEQVVMGSFTQMLRELSATDPDGYARYFPNHTIRKIDQDLVAWQKGIQSELRSGKLDQITVQYFYTNFLQKPPVMSSETYGILVRPTESVRQVSPEAPGNYLAEVERLKSLHAGKFKIQDGGGFVHFNNHLYGVTDRLYISLKPDLDPVRGLQMFQESLEQCGLSDKVYFKIHEHLSSRSESIVVYLSQSNSGASVAELLRTFLQKCPPSLLAEEGLSTASSVTKGISYAPEPVEYNQLLRKLGSNIESYNGLMAKVFCAACELAHHELTSTGKQVDTQTLQAVAQKYFAQLLKLCSIDPKTMSDASSRFMGFADYFAKTTPNTQ